MASYKSVARNEGYTRAAVSHIEKHNERKNTNYSNVDVVLEQSHLNVHFKQSEDTYLATFDKMVQNGDISTRGLKLNSEGTKPESSIIGEMVLDVGTEYFETNYKSHGYNNGYDFAKAFYTQAYQMAVEEVGDERYILSAVMHADERNKGLSEALGRDVYHYHLHVVYIPVVEKEILYSKRIKDRSLVGKVKEVIHQVSHSKKWECDKEVGDDGKEYLVYSYSKLQDRYHDFMKSAGFKNFERGKVGSTAEHLSVLDYKTEKRMEELAEKERVLAESEKALEQKSNLLLMAGEKLVTIDEQLAQKENRIETLTDKEKNMQGRIKSIEDNGQLLTLKQLEKMPTKVHAPLIGKSGVILSEEDEKSLRKMALAGARANDEVKKYKGIAKTVAETIRDIVQCLGLLKFDFKGDLQPVNNLTPEQHVLIATILKYGSEILNGNGYGKLVEDLNKAKMSKPMNEMFHRLEDEYKKKNKPSVNQMLENARQKSLEYDADAIIQKDKMIQKRYGAEK